MLLILLIYYYTNAGRGEVGIQHHVYLTKKIQTLVFINLSYLLTYRTVLFPAFSTWLLIIAPQSTISFLFLFIIISFCMCSCTCVYGVHTYVHI